VTSPSPVVRSILAALLRMSMAVLSLSIGGCAGLRYLTQAAAGQWELNRHGMAIDALVDGGYLDARTRELLSHVPRIKAFGEANGLRHTSNYTRYAWLGRPAVVWVVTVCDPLAFKPVAWRFPIVGSITYTGWFHELEARAYADEQARAGWDVDVRPSAAYSTLGWFNDPVLSTMIPEGDLALGDLADVVLHETLHATFFVPDQSTLNESVASFFGDELAVRYLDEAPGSNARAARAFLVDRARRDTRATKFRATYAELERVYASTASREAKLSEKARITRALRVELSLLRPVNNASLIQYKTYGSGRDELRALLAACGGSFPRMLAALERVRETARRAPEHSDPALLLRPALASRCE
jgi:predicted aminopeptidase